MSLLTKPAKTLVSLVIFGFVASAVFLSAPRARATAGHIETLGVSEVTASSALLHGSLYLPELALSPNSPFGHQQQVGYRFSFGTDPTLTTADHTSFSLAGDTANGQAVSGSLANLAAGAAYYYRLEVTRPDNFVMVGNIRSFNTVGNQGGVSVVHTGGAVVQGNGTVILNGQINPMSATPRYWFEYSPYPSLAASVATPFQTGANLSDYIDIAQTISGLTPGSMYYYRLAAQTVAGTAYGDVMSFGFSNVLAPSVASPGILSSLASDQTLYPRYARVSTADYSASAATAVVAKSPRPVSSSGSSNGTATTVPRVGLAAATRSPSTAALPVFPSTTPLESASASCVKLQTELDTYQIVPGGTVSSLVVATNGCPTAVARVVLFLGLPPASALVSSNNPSFVQNGQIVRYELGSISPGASVQRSVVVRISSDINAAREVPFSTRLEYTDSAAKTHAVAAAVSAFVGGSSAVSNSAASLVRSAGSFTGGFSLLSLFLIIVVVGLIAYRFFFSAKKHREGNVMKLGALRIVD